MVNMYWHERQVSSQNPCKHWSSFILVALIEIIKPTLLLIVVCWPGHFCGTSVRLKNSQTQWWKCNQMAQWHCFTWINTRWWLECRQTARSMSGKRGQGTCWTRWAVVNLQDRACRAGCQPWLWTGAGLPWQAALQKAACCTTVTLRRLLPLYLCQARRRRSPGSGDPSNPRTVRTIVRKKTFD